MPRPSLADARRWFANASHGQRGNALAAMKAAMRRELAADNRAKRQAERKPS